VSRFGVAFVGEVDHGKSTLIGRLLLETGSLPRSREKEVRSGSLPLAHVTDQLAREQDEGLTVTSGEAILKTAGGEIVLVDAPGHEEFLRHMLSGASAAAAAVVVVDALEGVREETRRHALLLKLLGIKEIAAAVNKIDLLEDAASGYSTATRALEDLSRELGLSFRGVIPCSAHTGLNVTVRPDSMSFYRGPTVLETLLSFRGPPRPSEGGVLFSVQDVYDFSPEPVVAGRLERGTLRPGELLLALPEGDEVLVEKIVSFPHRLLAVLEPGAAGTLVTHSRTVLRGGQVLCEPSARPRTTKVFQGRTFALGPEPLRCAERLVFRCATQETAVVPRKVTERFDSGTLSPRPAGETLDPFDIALVAFESEEPVVLEDPASVPSLGRFVLEEKGETVALGMVVFPEKEDGRGE